MHYSLSDSVSPEMILSDVLPIVGETGDYRELPKGFYYQQMQKALEALSFDTYFSKKMYSTEVPENLAMDIPKGMFNLRNMYLSNNNSCGIGPDSVNVYFKSNFFNDDGTGSGNYVARNKGTSKGGDPFYGNGSPDLNPRTYRSNDSRSSAYGTNERTDSLYFYNIQNGRIMFSSTCRRYSHVIMEFNGLDVSIGDKPIIPPQFREVVIDWVVEAVLRVKSARNQQQWGGMYNDSKQRLGRNPYHTSGTWHTAVQRAASLDSKAKEDLALYFSNFIK